MMSSRQRWFLYLSAAFLALESSQGWFITSPSSTKDWQELSSLVVQSFDVPPKDARWDEQLRWKLWEESLAIQSTYRKFVTTARKMKGNTKYTLLICKRWNRVVGMAEMGVTIDYDTQQRRPTIGLLCVDENYRQQGVGNDLIARSCEVAATVWKEATLFAEVEASNVKAVALFQSCGFENDIDMPHVMVNVRRGRSLTEERPHLLLRAELKGVASDTNDTISSSQTESS